MQSGAMKWLWDETNVIISTYVYYLQRSNSKCRGNGSASEPRVSDLLTRLDRINDVLSVRKELVSDLRPCAMPQDRLPSVRVMTLNQSLVQY